MMILTAFNGYFPGVGNGVLISPHDWGWQWVVTNGVPLSGATHFLDNPRKFLPSPQCSPRDRENSTSPLTRE